MSGRKTIGCCVHVATVIYYLSFAKYHEIKMPAEFLNSVFVDFDKMEPSNNPRYVRSKRGTKEISSSDDSESDTSTKSSDLKLDSDFDITDSEQSFPEAKMTKKPFKKSKNRLKNQKNQHYYQNMQQLLLRSIKL